MKKISLSFFAILLSLVANSQITEEQWVDSVYNSLTLQQRVGQLINARANYPNKMCVQELSALIDNYNIGGITFFRTDALPLLQQTNELQSLAQTPMMVCIDGEWGLGMRLNDAISYPYQMTLGAVQNVGLIGEMGRQIAEQCRRLGINVDFAPDIDVNNEPENPVIGMRSFGENPFDVAVRGSQYALALQNNGVLPSMKHFPGHGDTRTDSHETLPVVHKSLDEVRKTEIFPFQYLINKGVNAAMVGHLYIPAVEPVANTSSSMSYNVVTELLKKELGFDGIIFTDALEMKGAYKNISPDSVGLYALLAGNDVLLMPLNPQKTIEIIVDAAHDSIVNDRIEESCKKILKYKFRLGLNDYKPQPELGLDNDLKQSKYYNLRQQLYNEAVTLLRNKNEILPLDKEMSYAVVTFSNDDNVARQLRKQGYHVKSIILQKDVTAKECNQILKELKSFDCVIINIQNTSIFASKAYGITDGMKRLVKECSKHNRLVFNLFACPYALNAFEFKKDPSAVIIGYEDNQDAVNAVVDVMLGRINPKGKLPVSVNKKYKKGDGIGFLGMLTPETLPVSLINNEFTRKIDSIALNGIEIKAFPGCQIFAMKDGKVIYDKCFGSFTYSGEHEVRPDDVYDVASLTKVFASTLAMMKLYDDGKISMESRLKEFFPYLKGTEKGDLRLIEIMTHQAGLVPWIPVYKVTMKDGKPNPDLYRSFIDEEHTVRVADKMYLDNDFSYFIFDTVMNSSMIEKKYKYSDLGFYFLPKIVEMVTNQPFETYLYENFYKPLNLNRIFYKPLKHIALEKIAPTEYDTAFRMQQLHGDVHDQCAALFGGVSGHAGLFANARDIAVLLQLLLDDGFANNQQFLSKHTIAKFTSAPFADNMNRRGIGFDKPEIDPSVEYYTPAKQSSPLSFGHTGFTGTFAWADPENDLIVVFLSNRVFPDASNNLISKLNIRTNIHELFYDAVK
ncbi:MAG: glycoside hydrolase family 3 N-terminal domain-containing protein [Candidatus Limimorpha sp.]